MSVSYVRVVGRDHAGKSYNVRLLVTGENAGFLSGIEVRANGDAIVPKGEADERRHIIDKTTITRRTPLRMSRHYAELVEYRGW